VFFVLTLSLPGTRSAGHEKYMGYTYFEGVQLENGADLDAQTWFF